MAHEQQARFVAVVKRSLAGNLAGARVLEIGSYEVNGKIRACFAECGTYVGVDLTEGPGVDLVGSGHELPFEDGYFDVTVSCECFEHNPFWAETFQNMIRMTRPGGLVLATCASTGRIEHGTRRSFPQSSPGTLSSGLDYYRNLTQRDFERAVQLHDLFDVFRFYFVRTHNDLYFVGRTKATGLLPLDLCELDYQVVEIAKFREPQAVRPTIVGKALRSLYLMPVGVAARILVDKRFQDFALWFYGCSRWLKNALGLGSVGDGRP